MKNYSQILFLCGTTMLIAVSLGHLFELTVELKDTVNAIYGVLTAISVMLIAIAGPILFPKD